jgi:hypothetical protein
MPLKQGQPADIICLSSPSKPASKLILYKNDQIITNEYSSSMILYESEANTNKNITKLIYRINDPDSSWHNVIVRCEQSYQLDKTFRKDVVGKIQVYCE